MGKGACQHSRHPNGLTIDHFSAVKNVVRVSLLNATEVDGPGIDIGHGHGQIGKHTQGQPPEDQVELRVHYRSANKKSLGFSTKLLLPHGAFEFAGATMTNYPAGTRSIQLEISSQDTENNKGHYGPMIDGAHVVVGALQMRIANEDGKFDAWRDYVPVVKDWQLSKGPGTKTVTIEFRDAESKIALGSASDSIPVQ